MVFFFLPSHAAETLDAAVTNIAQKFAAVSTLVPAGETRVRRVAVTAFLQSDRKTTQFTNLLTIALTGKMVEQGSGTFRVIERAQLETALSEIQLSDVPIFDRDTARQLGKFLGVDTLIVGEITPIGDIVRVDARMIDVETIETVQQASDWVPLTPSIQHQLDTAAIMSRPRVGGENEPDPRNGVWNGTGACGETRFGVAVAIVVNPDNTLSAMQTYYPLPGQASNVKVQSGTLAMEGTIDPSKGALTLSLAS